MRVSIVVGTNILWTMFDPQKHDITESNGRLAAGLSDLISHASAYELEQIEFVDDAPAIFRVAVDRRTNSAYAEQMMRVVQEYAAGGSWLVSNEDPNDIEEVQQRAKK